MPLSLCDAATLGPLLERPPGSIADMPDAPRLRLRSLRLNPSRNCAVATYATRMDALAALEALCEPITTPSAQGGRAYDLVVCWALKHPVLRVSDLSPEVTLMQLRNAFGLHGELAPDGVRMEMDVNGAFTCVAYVTFTHRSSAAQVMRMCAENLLILAGFLAPARVDFARGALDEDELKGILEDDKAPIEAGKDLLESAWGCARRAGANRGRV